MLLPLFKKPNVRILLQLLHPAISEKFGFCCNSPVNSCIAAAYAQESRIGDRRTRTKVRILLQLQAAWRQMRSVNEQSLGLDWANAGTF